LDISYSSELILPEGDYNDLHALLVVNRYKLAVELCNTYFKRPVVIQSLVKLLEARGCALEFLLILARNEMNRIKKINTLFRHSSVATIAIDFYQQFLGLNYLKRVLGTFFETMLRASFHHRADTDSPFEVDPTRLHGSDEQKKKAQEENASRFVMLIFVPSFHSIHFYSLLLPSSFFPTDCGSSQLTS
jgi:hypothetical protein